MDKFHFFWKSFRTKSICGHVSGPVSGQNLLPDKTWNISRQYEKNFIHSEKVYGKKIFSKLFFGQNFLENICFLPKSGFSRQYEKYSFNLIKFPDTVSGKICFQTKYGIFPDSLKIFIQSGKVSKLNLFFRQVYKLYLFQDLILDFSRYSKNFIYS